MLEATVASRTNSITCPLPASLSSRPRPASQVCFCKEPRALQGAGRAPLPARSHSKVCRSADGLGVSSLCLEGLGGGGGGGERAGRKEAERKGELTRFIPGRLSPLEGGEFC